MTGEVFNIKHKNCPGEAVNIMRPGPWGNPFTVDKYGRGSCIRLYEHWLAHNPGMVEKIRRELAGKDVKCCCWPNPCHGDVIVRVAAGGEPHRLPDWHPLLKLLKKD